MKKISKTIFALALISLPLLTVRTAKAASGSFSISPTNQTLDEGDTFTVKLYTSSDEKFYTLQAYLNYSSQNAQVTSISTNDSIVSSWAEKDYSTAGEIKLVGGVIGGWSGSNGLVATINFEATDGGTFSLDFDSQCKMLNASDEDILTSGLSGVSYTISATSQETEDEEEEEDTNDTTTTPTGSPDSTDSTTTTTNNTQTTNDQTTAPETGFLSPTLIFSLLAAFLIGLATLAIK